MKLQNLTPHKIAVHDEDGNRVLTVDPSGDVARVSVVNELSHHVTGIPVYTQVIGDVVDLPPSKAGVVYVVSTLVRTSIPSRTDLASPGDLIRDDAGNPVGCRGLVFNH